MKPSKLNKDQVMKVAKAAFYVAASAAISALLTELTNNPDMFGVYTVLVNAGLVFLKQLFTPTE